MVKEKESRPERAKALKLKAFALSGRLFCLYSKTQGDALGYELLPFQGVWGLPAKVLSINIKRYNDLMVRGRLLFLLH